MLPPRRSVPNRRISVRMPGGDAAHKSFRLTRPVKLKFIARGFGKSFIPETFKKAIKAKPAQQAGTREERYFLRQARNDQTLTSSEQMKRFSKGFLQEAHEEGAKLRPGFNPKGNESAQAERLLKTYKAEVNKEPAWKERSEQRQKMESVRQRLGILHGQAPGAGLAKAITEPTPLGEGWKGQKGDWTGPAGQKPTAPTPGPAAPSLSASAGPFLGGNISAVVRRQAAPHGQLHPTIHVEHHQAGALYIGQTISDLDAMRLTNLTGLTVENRRAVSPLDINRTFAVVIVEDMQTEQTIRPEDVPRPRTALIVYGRGLSEERQNAWRQVGATEIINEEVNLNTIQAAIERYIKVRPSTPTPPVPSEIEPAPSGVHELPI